MGNISNLIDLNSIEDIRSVSPEGISRKDIAIIGISVRMPMANTLDEFWDNLKSGVDCVIDIPSTRYKDVNDYLKFSGEGSNFFVFEKAAYLHDIDKFDYSFFNISPTEARLMDPNQRLFLQTAWEAIEDAGYGGKRLIGSRTGVYVGYSGEMDYRRMISKAEPENLSIAVTGNLPAVIASRISYILDLKGPSILVNTVCSSSLIAVHLACQGIRNGECEMAIAGGVQLHVLPLRQVKIGIESFDGRTRPFDESSDGTGSGEGVAAILLKPLSTALRDKDNIMAVIKGSAVNQDGASIGISAPNPSAQADVIIKAWENAGIDPETISYIETHGTGTKLGDPIEIEGIEKAFRKFTDKKQFCAIGSVKSNIGHLDACAGIAGLLKAVLALKNRCIPPHLHFDNPNRKAGIYKSPVYINDTLASWTCGKTPRRCGVSSFSFCGTNCHVVLEEAPVHMNLKPDQAHGLHVLTISSKTKEALLRYIAKYAEFIRKIEETEIEDVCYTANTGRGHYNYRLALVFSDLNDLKSKLDTLCKSAPDHVKLQGVYYGMHKVISPNRKVRGDGEITQSDVDRLSCTAKEKIKDLLDTGRESGTRLAELCKLYTAGAEVDWYKLYDLRKRKKVRIPTYPFEGERCWVKIPVKSYKNRYAEDDEMYYTMQWKISPLRLKEDDQIKSHVLIMMDDKGIGKDISDRLRAEGKKVTEVVIGTGYRKVNDNMYVIRGTEEDYKRLFTDIDVNELEQLIHLMSIVRKNEIEDCDGLDEKLEYGVYSLFYLFQAICRKCSREIDLVVITEYGDEVDFNEPVINPENALLYGLGKAINTENSLIRCRYIDIDDYTDTGMIISELKSAYNEYSVAFRKSNRYIEELAPIEMPDTFVYGESGQTVKSDGVYIIAGGMGGLGLEIAKFLSTRNKIRIALLNRTKMPDRTEWDDILKKNDDADLHRKIKGIREIEGNGAEVICFSVDISKEDEIKTVINELKIKYGRINGIIQSAGIGVGRQGNPVQNDKIATFREVLLPKVHGTWLLEH
ncbi:MAG: SDR family NAD(P)-dependent oxidoreductase, partial [Caulobacteraceae bacterium]